MPDNTKTPSNMKYLAFLILFIGSIAFGLDKSKYISVDEIKRGMDAYCLTVLAGTEPKKHPLKVVSVIYNQTPGRNAILVMGTDEAFKHIGPVQGCSGSPVYIDGRMAGALSAGWTFSTDPLYAVTPIEYMLRVGSVADSKTSAKNTAMLDFGKPIDLSKAEKSILSLMPTAKNTSGGFNALPCPLLTSFPGDVCQSLAQQFSGLGLIPLAGAGVQTADDTEEKVEYVPGGVLSIPLVSGDIAMAAIGTVTEVIDDKVYGFGHSFLGQGAVNLPMAAGNVHTVVSSMNISFKLASAGKISGAIRSDESTAVFGKTGEKAPLIPLRIKINRFDAAQPKIYNCNVAYHRLYTPALLQMALAGAAQMQGSLPPDHVVEYKGAIGVKGYDPIELNNISSGKSVGEVVGEAAGVVTMLMNNPFGKAQIDSFDFEINIKPDNILESMSSVQLADTKVKQGEKIEAKIVLRSNLSEKTAYNMSLQIPKDLKPGKYKLLIAGSNDYNSFIRKLEPHRFIARDVDSLVQALKHVVHHRRDKLYMLLQLPSTDIAIEGNELVDLPDSKKMLLTSSIRTLASHKFGHWTQQVKTVPAIVTDGRAMEITVEPAM
jgi:hypothetical protein